MRVCVFVRVGETQVEPYANGRAKRTDVCAHLYGDRRRSRGGLGGGEKHVEMGLERPYPNILPAPRRCHMAAGGERTHMERSVSPRACSPCVPH